MDITFDSIFAQLAALRDKSDNAFPQGEADNFIRGDWVGVEPKALNNMDWIQPGVFLSHDPDVGVAVKAARETAARVRFEITGAEKAKWVSLEFRLRGDTIKKRGTAAFCLSGATNLRTIITPCLRVFKPDGAFTDHFRPAFVLTHVEESRGDVLIGDFSDMGEQEPRLIFFLQPKDVKLYLTSIQVW